MSREDPARPLPDTFDRTVAELGALLFKGYVRYRKGRERIERTGAEGALSPGERPASDTRTHASGDSEN